MFTPAPKRGLILPFDPDRVKHKKNIKVAVELPNGKEGEVVIPWWVVTPEQELERKRVLAGQFFLLKQGPLGEILICKRCKGKHRYFTDMCIELPFSGLTEGLYAYFYHTGRYGVENFLTEVELERYEAIRSVLSKSIPDFAARHPDTAKTLGTQENDFDAGTVAIGILEPITKEKAAALVWNINAHGRKPLLKLPGLETY